MFGKCLFSIIFFLLFNFVLYAGSGPDPKTSKKAGGGGGGIEWEKGKNKETWDTKRWIVGIQTGVLGFHGDINRIKGNSYRASFNDLKSTANGGLVVKYSLSHTISLRLSAYKGSFILDNRGREYGAYFYNIRNDITSLETQFWVNLGNISFLRRGRKLHMNLYTGFGTILTNLSGKLTSTHANPKEINFATDPYWSKNNKTHYATVPIGVGIMYNLNYYLDIGLETGLRYSRTDSLDFADFPEHRNRTFDKFSQTTVGLYFKFGSKKEPHYDWLDPMETVYDDVADAKRKTALLMGDADKDGVADALDKEPNTPLDSRVTGAGQAADTDGDSIPDFKDEEPFSDKGQPVDEKGVMIDDDLDGVPNGRDLEPNTPKENLVNFQGVTIPTIDYVDPKTRKRVKIQQNARFLPIVYFDTDKWFVKPEYYLELQAVGEIMRQFPELKLDIIGNADYRLDDAHNDMLGTNRAQSVIDILVNDFGVDKSRLLHKNNGERIPMVKGKGPAFDPYNRNTQIYISGTKSNVVR